MRAGCFILSSIASSLKPNMLPSWHLMNVCWTNVQIGVSRFEIIYTEVMEMDGNIVLDEYKKKEHKAKMSICIGVLQRDRQKPLGVELHVYEEIYYRNCLTQLWKLRRLMTCHLQAGEPGKLEVQFHLSPKVWDIGEPWVGLPAWDWRPGNQASTDVSLAKTQETGVRMPDGRRWCTSQLRKWAREFALPLLFSSVQAFSGLDGVWPCQWGRSLFSLLNQILVSSSNTLTDTPRNVLPAIWASLSPVKLMHKLSQHTILSRARGVSKEKEQQSGGRDGGLQGGLCLRISRKNMFKIEV